MVIFPMVPDMMVPRQASKTNCLYRKYKMTDDKPEVVTTLLDYILHFT